VGGKGGGIGGGDGGGGGEGGGGGGVRVTVSVEVGAPLPHHGRFTLSLGFSGYLLGRGPAISMAPASKPNPAGDPPVF